MGLLEMIGGRPGEEAAAAGVASAKERHAAEVRNLAQLEARLRDEEHDAALGDYGAAEEHAATLRPQLDEGRRRVAMLEAALREQEGRLAAAVAARLAREAAELELAVPELAAKHAAAAAAVKEAGQRLGDAMRDLVATGSQLAAAVGSAECGRAFGLAAIAERARHCLFNEFGFVPPGLARDPRLAPPRPFHFFPYPINEASPFLKMELDAAEQIALDDCVRVYGSKAQALRAKGRIGPKDDSLHAKKMESGAWRLVGGRLRGHLAQVDPAVRDAEPEEGVS